jgi:DnaJ homolog subfamily A member 2
MPSFRHHDFGNLYVQFAVKFPDKTELRNLEQLENVLPPRMVQPPPPADSMVDDYDIEDVDARGHARAQGAAGLGDDDDDDVPPGAERMQCASQ